MIKANFVAAFRANFGNVSKCCREVGVTRRAFYYWLSTDSEFKELIQEIEETFIDEAEEIIRRAVNGGSVKKRQSQTTKFDKDGNIIYRVQHVEQTELPPDPLIAKYYLEKQAAHRGWGKEGLDQEPPEIVFSDETEDDGDSTN